MVLDRAAENGQRPQFRLNLWRAVSWVLFVSLAHAAAPQQLPSTKTGFEVASIRMVSERDAGYFSMSPSGAGLFTMHNVNLQFAIAWAYGVDSDRVSGGPDWIDRQDYDISARPAGDAGLSYEQLRPLLQQLLQDRFHLQCHRLTKGFNGYDLVLSGKGQKLTPTRGGATHIYLFANGIDAQNAPMNSIAGVLGRPLQQPVEDKTGLNGNYDFHIKFAPFDKPDSSLPSLFTALEQLGLKLERDKSVPQQILVIDHVDRVPTSN